MAEAPRLPEEAMKALLGGRTDTRGVSLYSIVSAQASGVSDALLRGIASTKLDDFKKALSTYLEWMDTLAKASTTKDTDKGLDELRDTVESWLLVDGKTLVDHWKAGLGLQMGTAFMGLTETYTGYPQLLGMFKQAQLNASVRPRLDRYYLKTYTPNAPDSQTAFRMHMEGKLSRAEFNQYCSWEGWGSSWHDKLYALFDREPDEYTAFLMFKRGLISESKMKECFRIRGYDAIWDTALYQCLHRLPSFRELTNLADYVPLNEMWLAQTLRAIGYRETDIPYLQEALRLRPLREEVRSVLGRYLWRYQIGRLSREDLQKNLKAIGVTGKELELNMLWGDLRYQDELIDEALEIIEARVDAGDPDLDTQDKIKTAVMDIGILEEKANLISELWYYKYVYTPP